jgi:DNA-directed RNA polymerase specialized sigma24 family protein
MVGKAPHQRPGFETTPAEWDEVLEWRPFIYRQLARFGSKVTKRNVAWAGEIGTTTFRWLPDGQYAYGVEIPSLMQDLEYRALEAAVRAVQTFDPGRTNKFVTYLGKVITNALQDEFDDWVETSSSGVHWPLDDAALHEAPPLVDEDAGSGLDEETEETIQRAIGALTARQAWALRMYADGVPIEVIAERLGHKNTTSHDASPTFALIRRAQRAAQAAFEQQEETGE